MRMRMLAGLLSAIFLAPLAMAEIDRGALEAKAKGMSESALTSRADKLQADVEAKNTEIDELNDKLADAAEADKPAVQTEIDTANEAKADAIGELEVLIAAMREKGMNADDYGAFVIANGGTDMSVGAVMNLGKQWLDKSKTWLIEKAPGYGIKAVLFLVVMFVFRILSRVAGRVVRTSLELSRLKAPELLKDFFINVTSKVVMLLGLLVGLQVIGVPIAPLLAGIGVLGFVVGFALQDTLANFAAGIMLLLYRPYDVGDFVDVGGVTGTVNAMSLVSTTMKTPDNQIRIIPNGRIWGDVITNVTASPTRRVDLVMGIGYDDDIKKAHKVLEEVITSHEKVLKSPAPQIAVANLGESSVDFVVRPWCKTEDYWDVKFELTEQMKLRFDEEKISIPFPQRDIHVYKHEE